MKNFEKLNKNEMKMILGGVGTGLVGGCNDGCSGDEQCGTDYKCADLICSIEDGTYSKFCVPNNVKTFSL